MSVDLEHARSTADNYRKRAAKDMPGEKFPSLRRSSDELTARLIEDMADVIDAVLAIHRPDAHRVKSCVHDNEPWPCATAQACGNATKDVNA